MHDKVPFVVGALTAGVLPSVPGPTHNEWGIALVGLGSLLIRELVWWLRNRKSRK